MLRAPIAYKINIIFRQGFQQVTSFDLLCKDLKKELKYKVNAFVYRLTHHPLIVGCMHFGLNLISWLISNLIQNWWISEFLIIQLAFIFSVSTSFDTASKMTMKLSAIFWKSPMSPKKSWQTSRNSWACATRFSSQFLRRHWKIEIEWVWNSNW